MENKLIYQIDAVQLAYLDKEPVRFYLEVKATASTPGWSQINLVAKENWYDGIYEFEMVGVPPEDPIPGVLCPVMYTKIVSNVPSDIKGVKVVGKNNSVVQQVIQELPDPGSTIRPPENYPRLEPLYGVYLHKGDIKVRVFSGGCTQKGDFHVQVDKTYCDILPYRIAIYRNEPDYCDGWYPTGVELTFSLKKELNIPKDAPIEIVNPLVHHAPGKGNSKS